MQYLLVGLDIPAKARLFEQQVRHALRANTFTLLSFQLLGTPAANPQTQAAGTAVLRIVAQARTAGALAVPKFSRPIIDLVMCAYPGGTFHMEYRMGVPRPVYEYFVAKLPQADVQHRVHMHDGAVVEVPPPPPGGTRVFDAQQPRVRGVGLRAGEFGGTVRAPLGLVAHARSGDKGSDANVGFFVSDAEQYEWLRKLLSVDRVKELLAGEYNGKEIDRFEFPNIRGVHFLLHDHLDRGVGCTSTVDFLGKNVAEFLRAREVDVPRRFLKRKKASAKL
ncbi:hypothetical protein K438DRAFT_1633700 [Mycena galopus ATCC 62051]|nr:hypothetical protein K438DRAFT_1633700 [Mycena galopus ATCC 62051]